MDPHVRKPFRSLRLTLVAVLLATAVLTVDTALPRSEPAADALTVSSMVIELRADRTIVISNAGRILRPGADVRWQNRSGRTLEVTSPTGTLDSGPIPDGGSYYASLPVAGGYVWQTEVGSGVIPVAAELDGSPDARALDSIPDVPPPPVDPVDVSLHPTLRVELPRSRAIVGFSETATVAQAEAALGNNWEIVGGLPRLGLVVVQRSSALSAHAPSVIEGLRSQPAVEFVSLAFEYETTALPPPSGDADIISQYWDSPSVSPDGAGLNWNHEFSRVPAAWNLLDALGERSTARRATTVVLDSSFAPHDDLSRLEIVQTCGFLSLLCTYEGVTSDHGNHVAGIVGADFDDDGVTGVDPFGRLLGLPWNFGGTTLFDRRGDILLALDLLLRDVQDGRFPMPDVVNMSVQVKPPDPDDWWQEWEGTTCGPGLDDDATGTDVCVPDHEDGWVSEVAEMGGAHRRAVERFTETAGASTPLFVVSTGNISAKYCAELRGADCFPELAEPQDAAEAGSPMTWAERNWDVAAYGEPPILSVESIGNFVSTSLVPGPDRSFFSNVGGDISAPGSTMSTGAVGGPPEAGAVCRTGSDGVSRYCLQGGTSQAAPLVSGIASLMSTWDPSLTAIDVRRRLVAWSVPDTTGGASPRVDAFDPLVSLPGAARALVDVNDPTVDGNRRIVFDADGSVLGVLEVSSTTPGRSSEADGSIDLRDFRRFRDAWLLRCLISPEAGCPTAIDLDGDPEHPKFDLNADGCVARSVPAVEQTCPSELTFPRFDFNGDGDVSLTRRARVPLQADGSPAADPSAATEMTDLEVLQSQWDDGAPASLGITAADLDDLMVSGDVSVQLDGLERAGATNAAIALVDDDTDETYGAFTIELPSTFSPVVTAPADRPLRLEVAATTNAGPFESTAGPFELVAGQDLWVDPCATLELSSERDLLRRLRHRHCAVARP